MPPRCEAGQYPLHGCGPWNIPLLPHGFWIRQVRAALAARIIAYFRRMVTNKKRQKNKKLATSCCGTPIYQAPEVNRPEKKQSPKMDIWSLLASLLDVHPSCAFPPPRVPDHQSVVKAILEITQGLPLALRLMGRENPKYRASAAQLLLLQFGGKGLTTRREAIPEIIEDIG